MRLYSCKVRLSGSLYNEVFKDGVSAAEIILLQHAHSPQADDGSIVLDTSVVTDIKEVAIPEPSEEGAVEARRQLLAARAAKTDGAERAYLQSLYGGALKKKSLTLAALFGMAGALPQTVDGGEQLVQEPVIKRGPGRPKKVETEAEVETAAAA